MDKISVALLFGGSSREHTVSLMSAISVFKAIDKEKYRVVPVAISKEGRWLNPDESLSSLDKARITVNKNKAEMTLAKKDGRPCLLVLNSSLQQYPLDIVFPLLHGPLGEDGSIQGFCEFLGVPYVGAGVLASAVGMDKDYMKRIFAGYGLPQTAFLAIRHYEWRKDKEGLMGNILSKMEFPLFVKPANLGSSVGIAKANSYEELLAASEYAFTFDKKVIIEEYVPGRELECAVLGNDYPEIAGPGEIIFQSEFYDYEAKYSGEATELILNPDLSKELRERMCNLALGAYKAIECRGMARVDFFLTPNDEILINEINTIPGFTEFSMYPKLWEAKGLDYGLLIDTLIQLALERCLK